jgi:hypothetical protein
MRAATTRGTSILFAAVCLLAYIAGNAGIRAAQGEEFREALTDGLRTGVMVFPAVLIWLYSKR